MDLSTSAAVAGITLLSVATVYALIAAKGVPTRVPAIGTQRRRLFLLAMTVSAAAYLVSSSPWSPVPQAGSAGEDADVARLRMFASTLPSAKSAPMSRIPANGVRAHDDLPDVDTMIERLAARLSDTPEDGEGWKMLGWSLLHTDRPGDAANAYAKARRLMPTSEDVAASLAEAIIARDAGTVGDEAQAIINDVLRVAPEFPKARYFQALARSQRGEPAAALVDMKAIEGVAEGDALWIEQMRARIAQLSASLVRASE